MIFPASLVAALALAQSGAPDWIFAQGSTNCSATDVDFSDSRHGLASCAFSLVMKTSDGGLNWTVLPTGLGQSLVFAHASTTNELYVARLGLYRSLNGGANWSEVGALSAHIGSIFDVHFDGNRRVAIQGGNLRLSTDGGSSWQVAFAAQQDVFFDELHFPGASTGFATGGNTSELGSFGSVARTVDGGTHWNLLAFPHGHITAADFISATTGAVATITSRIQATSDGGASWQALGNLPDSAYLTDLVMRSDRHWYGTSAAGCILETEDAGATWVASFCDPASRALSAISLRGGAAVAVGNDGLVLFENRIFLSSFDTPAQRTSIR
jgi:photosystem II stability/assembly factor-like uncharacterized protein